jgi:hypothetical protein
MNSKQRAVVVLVAALAVGAIVQGIAKNEAAILGMSTFELALAGFVVGGAVLRLKSS